MRPEPLDARLASLRKLPVVRRKHPVPSAAKSRPGRTFRPELHPLEDRTVLDGTVKLDKGVLLITGTAGNDTAIVRQTVTGNQPERVNVTLNGVAYDFKASNVIQIQAQLLGGDDTITLDESTRKVTPPSSFNSDGGTNDSLIYKGTAGADAITVTGSTIALPGAGLLTYSNFESVDVNCLGGTDTATATMATLTGQLIVRDGTVANSSIGTVAVGAILDVSEVPLTADAGLLKDSTFGTVFGHVHAGSIVNTHFGSITGSVEASGQGTTTNVSIGTLSGSFTAPEDSNPGSGTMSNTTIDSITSTGTVSTGAISGMAVGANAGSITAAGQGTTTNVSIGTLSGSFTAPEDSNPGSGTMSNTTIDSITSTGTVSTGAISGMTVGTTDSGSSITAAGHGTISNISIGTLGGSVTAEKDANALSGTITNALVVTVTSTGQFFAGASVTNLTIVTIEGGSFTAGSFEMVTAEHVTADSVALVEADATRTIQLVAVPGSNRPAEFSFTYDHSGVGNPKVSVEVDAGTGTNIRGDLSLLTDTVGKPGSGIDLISLTASDKAFLRNVVVAGSLTPAPGTPAVNLPLDSVAVAVAGNIPASGIALQSTPAIAFGAANGIPASAAGTSDVASLFVTGPATVQANDTFAAFVGEGTPVGLFLVTGANGSNFDSKPVLFADQQADFLPVTAAVRVDTLSGNSSTVRQVDLAGEAASFQTQQFVSDEINVIAGSLGDVTLRASGGTSADITAPRIVGNIDVTNGAISGTIQTKQGDFGRAFRDASGTITGVTFVRAGAGGLTATGRIISAANLISLIDVQSSLDGVVAAQGDIGVIQTDSLGNAVVGPAPALALTRFGGVNVSTGGMKGSIVALGNAFGDLNVSGGLDGRIAVKGRLVAGLTPFRTGILGNVNIGGGVGTTAAIVSGGLLGDDGGNNVGNDTLGTRLNISGAVKGILAAVGDINFGSVGNMSQAFVFENVGPTSTNGEAIAAIFSDGGVDLTVPAGLDLILFDLSNLRVGPDGKLTGTIA